MGSKYHIHSPFLTPPSRNYCRICELFYDHFVHFSVCVPLHPEGYHFFAFFLPVAHRRNVGRVRIRCFILLKTKRDPDTAVDFTHFLFRATPDIIPEAAEVHSGHLLTEDRALIRRTQNSRMGRQVRLMPSGAVHNLHGLTMKVVLVVRYDDARPPSPLLLARNKWRQSDIEDVSPLDPQIAHSIRSPFQIALRSSSSSSLLGQSGSRPRRRRLLRHPW